ncbi:LemA family protein, partial [Clostridium botulinum]|nr:LemA family protein [Clostridium botulinum]
MKKGLRNTLIVVGIILLILFP